MYFLTSPHPLGFVFGPVYEVPTFGKVVLRKAEFDTGTGRWLYEFMPPPVMPQ